MDALQEKNKNKINLTPTLETVRLTEITFFSPSES